MMDFTPLDWKEFFDRKEMIELEEGDRFNIYLKGTTGPLFYLLHGGGYSGLSWACFSEQLTNQIECQILAPDLRNHGETKTIDNDDLSADRLLKDISGIYNHFFRNKDKPPPIVLIGHSMGGAMAIRAAHSGCLPNVLVVSAIDVVEGSAMASLNVMQQFLRSRPQTFSSVEKAVEWCVKNKVASNLRAARISMPSRLATFEDNSGQVRLFYLLHHLKEQFLFKNAEKIPLEDKLVTHRIALERVVQRSLQTLSPVRTCESLDTGECGQIGQGIADSANEGPIPTGSNLQNRPCCA